MDKLINDDRIDLTMDRIFGRTKKETTSINPIDGDIKVSGYRSFNTNFGPNRINFQELTFNIDFSFTSRIYTGNLYDTRFPVPDERQYIGKDKINTDALGQYEFDPPASSDSYKCPVCGKVNEKLFLNKTGTSPKVTICDKCLEAIPHVLVFKNIKGGLLADKKLDSFEDKLYYHGIEFTEYIDNSTYIRSFLSSNNTVYEYDSDNRPRTVYERIDAEIDLMMMIKDDKPDLEMSINLY
ncbi:MAG: hypothetical protein ACRCXT_06235 [Paraclostridium sp.]